MPNRNEIIEIFKRANAGGYAIPHINFSDFGDLYAIVDSGEKAHTPIIAASTMMTADALGINKIVPVAKVLGAESSVPFILHLDHCPSPEKCVEAIDAGYNMVMIDGSDKPLDENIELVRKVVDYAHPRGVFVEAEVGHVGHGDEGSWDANVDEAKRLVDATDIDALALAIGNEHGFYKEPPKLNYGLLSAVHEAMPEMPLVLHGGSGIPVDDVRHSIECGIRKVNVGTDVRCAYVAGLRDGIAEMGIERHTADIVAFARRRAEEKIAGVIDMCWARDRA